MLPCSSEITILRKQNRKGSDVSRNRITRKQKPPRLALFQKLELGTFEPFPVFFGFRGKSFSRHTWTNHTSILLYWILFSDIMLNIGCCCRYKRMSEKTGRWNCGWIPVRIDMEEIGAKVKGSVRLQKQPLTHTSPRFDKKYCQFPAKGWYLGF